MLQAMKLKWIFAVLMLTQLLDSTRAYRQVSDAKPNEKGITDKELTCFKCVGIMGQLSNGEWLEPIGVNCFQSQKSENHWNDAGDEMSPTPVVMGNNTSFYGPLGKQWNSIILAADQEKGLLYCVTVRMKVSIDVSKTAGINLGPNNGQQSVDMIVRSAVLVTDTQINMNQMETYSSLDKVCWANQPNADDILRNLISESYEKLYENLSKHNVTYKCLTRSNADVKTCYCTQDGCNYHNQNYDYQQRYGEVDNSTERTFYATGFIHSAAPINSNVAPLLVLGLIFNLMWFL